MVTSANVNTITDKWQLKKECFGCRFQFLFKGKAKLKKVQVHSDEGSVTALNIFDMQALPSSSTHNSMNTST